MPYYEYKCTSKQCNKETTINCKMSEMSPTIKCECGEIMTRKIENLVAGYQFNCSGAYGKKSD